MSISIRLLLTRLATGSNQPGSTSETQPRTARTHTIRMKTDSDSEDKLLVIYRITQTMPRALTREILKDQSRYKKPSETVTSLLLKLQQEDAWCTQRN